MLFDPILNMELSDDDEILKDPLFLSQPLICSHCHIPIKGKYYQSGKDYYDEYCWQFRFVIDSLHIERASRRTVKEFDEDGNEC